MNRTQFNEAVANNSKILARALETRITDFSEIIFWEGKKGKDLSIDQLMSKGPDIIGCCVVGALPSIQKSGADGFGYFGKAKNPQEVESKLCGVRHENIHIGRSGALSWSSDPTNKNNKGSMQTHFTGSYDANMSATTLKTKARRTFLVCFDQTTNEVICAYSLSPRQVAKELDLRQSNATLSLKLNVFMRDGKEAQYKVKRVGWEKWYKNLQQESKNEGRFIGTFGHLFESKRGCSGRKGVSPQELLAQLRINTREFFQLIDG